MKKLGLKALETGEDGLEDLPLTCISCQKTIEYLPLVQACFHCFHSDCIVSKCKSKRECTLCLTKCLICYEKINTSDDSNTLAFTENLRIVHQKCFIDFNVKLQNVKKNRSILDQIHPITLRLCCLSESAKVLFKTCKGHEISDEISKSNWFRISYLEDHLSQLLSIISDCLKSRIIEKRVA